MPWQEREVYTQQVQFAGIAEDESTPILPNQFSGPYSLFNWFDQFKCLQGPRQTADRVAMTRRACGPPTFFTSALPAEGWGGDSARPLAHAHTSWPQVVNVPKCFENSDQDI